MCLTCQCHSPSDGHGDRRQITIQHLQAAAQANGITPLEVAQRILAEMQRVHDAKAGERHNPTEVLVPRREWIDAHVRWLEGLVQRGVLTRREAASTLVMNCNHVVELVEAQQLMGE